METPFLSIEFYYTVFNTSALIGNAVMLEMSVTSATKAIESCQAFEYELNGNKYSYFACPHPGILMREDENGKWKGYLKKIIEEVKELI